MGNDQKINNKWCNKKRKSVVGTCSGLNSIINVTNKCNTVATATFKLAGNILYVYTVITGLTPKAFKRH